MAEGTYEYECMRAELLGLKKPDYEEFLRNKKENDSKQIDDEHLDTEALRVVDGEDEQIKGISGGLDELNSILKKTQIKINRFKASCGSLTNLLKIKVGGKSGSQTSLHVDQQSDSTSTMMSSASSNAAVQPLNNSISMDDPDEDYRNAAEIAEDDAKMARKSDLSKALDKDLSAIDKMIEKAESAQYSMEYQRKEMRKFLN